MLSASPNTHRTHRAGLTLIELVVVMAVLVALAGIIIPILPGIIGRAETSARATNSSEIYKWIQNYEATTSQYPYDWDSLIDVNTSAIASYVGGGTGTTAPLVLLTLTSGQAAALTGGGIGYMQQMGDITNTTLSTAAGGNGYDAYSDTFNPYQFPDRSQNRTAIASGVSVVSLSPTGQWQLGLADNATVTTTYNGTPGFVGTGVYVVFGLGRRCSLIGTGAADAPVNFYDKFSLDPSPTGSYARYGVVFQVSGLSGLTNAPVSAAGTTAISDFGRCKLVKVFRFGGTLTTGDDAIKSYWDDVTTVTGS
jgi:prepilin-type N-terminal cleavage/methylation domain-containing protein